MKLNCVFYGGIGAKLETEVLGNNPDHNFFTPSLSTRAGIRVDLGDAEKRKSAFEYGNFELIPLEIEFSAELNRDGDWVCQGTAMMGLGANISDSCRLEIGIFKNTLLGDPNKDNEFEDKDTYATLRVRWGL
jgi:hypothetical protein